MDKGNDQPGGMMKLPRVKNSAPAEMQITSE